MLADGLLLFALPRELCAAISRAIYEKETGIGLLGQVAFGSFADTCSKSTRFAAAKGIHCSLRPWHAAQCDSKASTPRYSVTFTQLLVNFSSTNQRADSFS
jgi:hypothetical protein